MSKFLNETGLARFWAKCKAAFAAKTHTHNYAGSGSVGGAATTALSCTGNAATATKLATARTINGVNFDGSVNITVADGTKLPLTGGDVTGNLGVNGVLRNGRRFENVAVFEYGGTVDEIVVKTRIPYVSSNEMPLIHLKGYAYGAHSPIELTVAFYIYKGSFAAYGCMSTCPWHPTIKLSSYTVNGTEYVALSLCGTIYFARFIVDMVDIWNGTTRDYSAGWTVEKKDVATPTSIVPTDNLVVVPYKAIANDITGNASTATKATQDSAGQQINTTYIKGLAVSGRTITYTKGNGTTGTITTQDTNTTYGVATASANGLMSNTDKAKLDGIAAGAGASAIATAATLSIAGWTGTAAPYTQSVAVSGMTAAKAIIVGLSGAATAAQRAVAGSAGLCCTAQGTGTVTITADGAKPGVALPIIIMEV